MVGHLHVPLAARGALHTVQADAHGDGGGGDARVDDDGALTVVHQGAERRDGLRDLEGALVADQHVQHARRGGGQARLAAVHHGVAERDDAVAAHVRDGADAGGGHVAAHQLHADGAAVDVASPRITRGAPGAAGLDGVEAQARELAREHARDPVGEAAQHERGLRRREAHRTAGVGAREASHVGAHRGECVRVGGRQRGRARPSRSRATSRATRPARGPRGGEELGTREAAGAQRTVQLRQHVGDGRHPNDRVRAVRPAVRVRPGEASIQVDRAAAHAADGARAVEQRVRCAHQDQVLVGPEVVQHVDDLDVEALRLGARQHAQAVTPHARANLAHGDGARAGLRDADRGGYGSQRRHQRGKEDGSARHLDGSMIRSERAATV